MFWKKYLNLFLTILVLAILGWYVIKNISDFKSLLEINPIYLVLVFTIQILIIIEWGLFFIISLKPFNIKFEPKKAVFASFLTSFGNFFLPWQSGGALRALYLNKRYKLSYTDFLAVLAGTFIVVFSTYSLVGLVSLLVIRSTQNIFSVPLFLLFLGIFVVCVILMFKGTLVVLNWFKRTFKPAEKIFEKFIQINTGWRKLTSVLPFLLLIILLDVVLNVIMVKIEFLAIGKDLSILNILIYNSISAFSFLINLTPGSIGIRESLFLFFSQVLSVDTSQILKVAIIDRSVQFFILALFFLISSVFNIESLGSIISENKTE